MTENTPVPKMNRRRSRIGLRFANHVSEIHDLQNSVYLKYTFCKLQGEGGIVGALGGAGAGGILAEQR